MNIRKFILVPLLALLLPALSGCADEVELSSGTVKNNARELTAVVTPKDLLALDGFQSLDTADFSGSRCYAALAAWKQRHPTVKLQYTVAFPGGILAEYDCETLDLSGLSDEEAEDAAELLPFLSNLKSVNLGSDEDGLSPSSAMLLMDACPGLSFSYHCSLFGKDSVLDETELDLSDVSPREIRRNLDTIACLRSLKRIDLGDDSRKNAPDWDLITELHEAAPQARLVYSFHLYDLPVTLDDVSLDLSYIHITDEGELVRQVTACMPELKTLNMDSCGVSNESMAKIRDALPDTEVIWRINFGVNYTVLTNAVKILASSPSQGGRPLYDSDLSFLQYCPKIKYLDIGHNETITDLSFVRWLPELEVLIIAMNPLGDLSPLADCENLEYLELFYSNTTDLSPLAGLKNLKHLNVGHCRYLTDISGIYDLELERFYLGVPNFTPVPAEQVDRYRSLHPDCEVDNTTWESSEGAWRRAANLQGEELEWYQKQPYYREDRKGYAPRYALLRDQFGYDSLDYSVKWNDPSWHWVAWMP